MAALRRSTHPVVPEPIRHPGADAPIDIHQVRGLLAGLDRQQRRAVTHGDGPCLVVAGPGTGKTEVITRRIAWLIASRKARPSEILALTFTERAASEMQARVDLLVAYGQADVAVSTFHAFGDRLVREQGHSLGLPDEARVIGRSQAVALVRDNIFGLGLDRFLPMADPTRFVGALVDLFVRAKEEGIRPEDLAAYARELGAGAQAARAFVDQSTSESLDALLDEAASQAELARAYAAYQALLAARSLVDHGDQVALAVRILEERPSVRMALRRRLRYVVVDETQDADPQQLQLVLQLVGSHGQVTLVGDDDQAIYGFRGAVGGGLGGLESAYGTLTEVVLRRNYRSRQPILDAARRLIRHNDPDRLEVRRGLLKELTAVRRSRKPPPVTHRVYATSAAEADAVAGLIRERIERGADPASLAVLVRTNADAKPVLASLQVLGIPHRSSGASGLLGYREVRDALSLIQAIADPESSEDLYAVLAGEPYLLGGEDLTRICERASRSRRSLWSVVSELAEQPASLSLAPRTRKALTRVVTDLRAGMDAAHQRPAPEVLYDQLRRSGLLRRLVVQAESGDDGPLRRMATFFELVREQSEVVSDPRLASVAPTLRALIDAGHDPVTPDADDLAGSVAVLTVHQAKGLEFAVVYVVGLAEGRFPTQARRAAFALPEALTGRPGEDDPDRHLAEERRLFYVALTRARDESCLSHAVVDRAGGRPRRPSRFLAEALGHEVATGPLPEPGDLPASLIPGAQGRPAQPAPPTAAARPSSLSFTQIDDYRSCPLKYRLRHQVGVPTAPHHALVVGSALHQAVAAANNARMNGAPVDPQAIELVLRSSWRSEGFLSQEHEAARFAAATVALARFQEQARRAQDTLLAVERPFSVCIGDVRVRGRYDAVRESSEGVVITDYKSGDVRDPERARRRARDSLQLQLYAIAWEAEHGRRPAAVELHFLEGDTIGRYVPTDRQLQAARDRVEQAADGIAAGRFEPTPGYPACDWCPYRRICPASR